MKKYVLFLCGIILTAVFAVNVNAAKVTIADIPAYSWYHGCGPTAAASIIGYYDLHGYDALFNGSGWDGIHLTSDVQDEITSPEHNVKYGEFPDWFAPEPADTSIADFFHTSENYAYGWSYLKYADDAFVGYANYRGYDDWQAWNMQYGTGAGDFTWEVFKNEIDENRPMMFLIDNDGNGQLDHFVPVFGYDEVTRQYGFYTTWSEKESIVWREFQGMNNQWGVGAATFIVPGAPDPVPLPSTISLFGLGLFSFYGARRKRRE